MSSEPKTLGDRVTGKDRVSDEFTEEERAQIRHRNEILDADFLSPNDFAKEMGLGWLANISKAIPGFAKLTAIYAIITAAIAVVYKYLGLGGG